MEAIEVVRKEVVPIPDQAKLIMVKDQASMTRANEMFLVIKGLRKKIAETMDPIIKSAHETHKKALGKKAELEAPLVVAEKWLNGQMTAYHKQQEDLRRAEEERLRKEAWESEIKRRKEEEERKLAEAAILEAAGAKDEAEQLVNEAIQDKEEPVIVEVKAPETPKVEMTGATVKKYWDFEVVNEDLIPREYLTPDLPRIGSVVRALKEKASIPGVRIYQRSSLAATGR